MCDEKAVDRIVKAYSTPKWIHNVLTVLGTLSVMLLGAILTTVLDNREDIQSSKLTLLQQVTDVQRAEDKRHIEVSASMAMLLADSHRMEEINALRCVNVNSTLKGLKEELQREIKFYHPASFKGNK